MSVISMTNLAISRRADPERGKEKGPESLDEIAAAKDGSTVGKTSTTNALSAIVAYIPTEIVTVYVAVLTTLGVTVPPAAAANGEVVTATPLPVYALFILLTPVVVWGLYASRVVAGGKRIPKRIRSWPKWEMLAATLAFAAWGAAMPSSPLEVIPGFQAALAGVVALVLSLLIGVFSPLFSSKPLAV
jgi:hypothetical protein